MELDRLAIGYLEVLQKALLVNLLADNKAPSPKLQFSLKGSNSHTLVSTAPWEEFERLGC